MKVLNVITGLGQGGAETVLFRVVANSSPSIEHTIISLTDTGSLGERFEGCGASVHALQMPRGRITVRGLMRLYRLVRLTEPAVMQTWMYHADLAGGIVGRLGGVPAVVWGVRNNSLDPKLVSRMTRLVAKTCARLSGLVPIAIVCNSVVASRVHVELGYRADRFRIIPNGYDVNHFAPDRSARKRVRVQWAAGDDERLLGMVARWDPTKDHHSLLKALRTLVDRGRMFRCVLVGDGMNLANETLATMIRKMELDQRIILAGPRDDIPAVMNALDLHVLSSASEAFPNVVAEAMACGTPCVVTDVGDAATIVGSTGWVAPAGDAIQLAGRIEKALVALASPGRDKRSAECRARIAENFSIGKMVEAYESVWIEAAERART